MVEVPFATRDTPEALRRAIAEKTPAAGRRPGPRRGSSGAGSSGGSPGADVALRVPGLARRGGARGERATPTWPGRCAGLGAGPGRRRGAGRRRHFPHGAAAWGRQEGGRIVEWRVLEDEDDVLELEPAYVVRAPLPLWKELLRGRADPVQAALSGRVKVKGDLEGLVRRAGYRYIVDEALRRCRPMFPDEVSAMSERRKGIPEVADGAGRARRRRARPRWSSTTRGGRRSSPRPSERRRRASGSSRRSRGG